MTAKHDLQSTGTGATTARWSAQDLALLERTGEVRIAAARTGTDTSPHSRSTPIWIVVHDGEAYIRAYTGTSSRWAMTTAGARAAALRVRPIRTDSRR